MTTIRVCYQFNLIASIIKRNGRQYNNHFISQLGFSYYDAALSAYFELKRKKARLIKIHAASVAHIAFAYDQNPGFIKASLKDHPVQIPDDLNGVWEKYCNYGL